MHGKQSFQIYSRVVIPSQVQPSEKTGGGLSDLRRRQKTTIPKIYLPDEQKKKNWIRYSEARIHELFWITLTRAGEFTLYK
jgi:hypothetical protein